MDDDMDVDQDFADHTRQAFIAADAVQIESFKEQISCRYCTDQDPTFFDDPQDEALHIQDFHGMIACADQLFHPDEYHANPLQKTKKRTRSKFQRQEPEPLFKDDE